MQQRTHFRFNKKAKSSFEASKTNTQVWVCVSKNKNNLSVNLNTKHWRDTRLIIKGKQKNARKRSVLSKTETCRNSYQHDKTYSYFFFIISP